MGLMMTRNLLRKMPLAFGSILAATSAFGAMDMDSRVSRLESEMKDVRTETANHNFGAKTASTQSMIKGRNGSMNDCLGGGWFATADLLYWRLYEGGNDFAYSDHSPAGLPINGHMRTIVPDFEWGFRIGLGYFFQRDGWDLYLNGTWFESDKTHYVQAGPNTVFYPNVPYPRPGALVTTVTTSSGKLEFNFRNLDLELGRGFYVSKYFSLRHHYGLRAAWISQKKTETFAGGDLTNQKIHIHHENKYKGLGPRTGIDTQFHIGKGFTIEGKLALALLAGRFRVEYDADISEDPSTEVDIEANIYRFAPTIQFFLGFGYDINICRDEHHLAFRLGYENQYWWRQNQMLEFNNVTANAVNGINNFKRQSEDFGIHGVTFSVKFDF